MNQKSIWKKFIQRICGYFCKELHTEYERTAADLAEAHRNLDTLRAEHERATVAFNKLGEEHDQLRGEHERATVAFNKLDEEHDQLRGEHERATVAFNKLDEEHDQLRAEHERATVALNKLGEEHDQLRGEHENLSQKYERTAADLAEAHRNLDTLRAEHERATVAFNKLGEEHDRLRREHENLSQKYERTAADLAEAHRNLDTLRAEHERATVAFNKLGEEHDQLRGEHERATVAFNKLDEEHDQLRGEHERATVAFNKLDEEHDQLRAEHERATVALNKLGEEHDQLRGEHENLSQKYERTAADLAEAHRNLDTLRAEHERATVAFNKLGEEHDRLRREHENLSQKYERTAADLAEAHRNLDTLRAEHERATVALNKLGEEHDQLRGEHENLSQKYGLVSNLLKAKRGENEKFENFKNLFEKDFMDFANKESSLAEEASAVQKLQGLEKKLEEIVAFPHTFTKKSIAIGGGFSSGKSAFVNSFITHPDIELPVDIKPSTAIPSFVISNPKDSIKGFSSNGATVDIELEFYRQLSRDFIDTFPFNLKDIMPHMAVEVPLKEGLFENIYLIDTPGYNPAGESTTEDRSTATDFLKDRDALIWMIGLDATGTIPQNDLDFINAMELNGLPFYVVLNKSDLKPESELEEILDEVRETLDDEGIGYVGISAYSAEHCKQYPSRGMSLHDFLVSQNQSVGNTEAELKREIEDVFAMYEGAIDKDENTAKLLMKELSNLNHNLNRDILKLSSDGLDPDEMDVLQEKIDRIIKDQKKDFTPIKKQMREIKKNMLEAVDEVFWSLGSRNAEAGLRPQSPASKKKAVPKNATPRKATPKKKTAPKKTAKKSAKKKKSAQKPAFKNPQPRFEEPS